MDEEINYPDDHYMQAQLANHFNCDPSQLVKDMEDWYLNDTDE